MQNVRIYEIPDCKMVSSGCGMFGDGVLERFSDWMGTLPHSIYPLDFLFYDNEKQGFVWLYIYTEGMEIPDGFELVDFKGGLYAVANDIDGDTDTDAMGAEVDKFLAEHGFEHDTSRPELGNVITTPAAKAVLGYDQMDYWTPIKPIK